jgi:adenosylcobinamide kinase/adenosylcobinamide-phosphate guanylyltransferase
MAEIVLVTGGGRSGKSAYAQRFAESLVGPRLFVATCPVIDAETAERVRKHREARASSDWETAEETVDLAGTIRRAKAARVLLVDCLTLWVNNLFYAADQAGGAFTEAEMAVRGRELLASCAEHPGMVIFVANELGMGIVPENALARRFRDCAGRLNQIIAAAAGTVTLVVAGIPFNLKPLQKVSVSSPPPKGGVHNPFE